MSNIGVAEEGRDIYQAERGLGALEVIFEDSGFLLMYRGRWRADTLSHTCFSGQGEVKPNF